MSYRDLSSCTLRVDNARRINLEEKGEKIITRKNTLKRTIWIDALNSRGFRVLIRG